MRNSQKHKGDQGRFKSMNSKLVENKELFLMRKAFVKSVFETVNEK